MFFSDYPSSQLNKLNSVKSEESSLSPVNSYVNLDGFRPLPVRKDSELYSRSTDGSYIDNRMDSSKFTNLNFKEKNETVGDETTMSHNGSPLDKTNVPMRKATSYSQIRLGTPLKVPNTSKSERSTFHFLGIPLESSSSRSRMGFTPLDSPFKRVIPKTESLQMSLDNNSLYSPKNQPQFVDAGLEVPGLEHRISMNSQDYCSAFSSSRLSSFVPDPGSFFDLAQYKAKLEEQLSQNKSDSMRKCDSNDSLEYRLFGETQEYNNLVNPSGSLSSELSNESLELESIMDTTQFDRFSHFGYSFNKLLNSLTWLASLHLSCRNTNFYLNRYDNNRESSLNQLKYIEQEDDHQTSCRYVGMDTINGGGDGNYYQDTSVNQYPVNYVTDHDMTPKVQTTMQGYPVYSNTMNTSITTTLNYNNNINNNYNNMNNTNYTMNNTQFASNIQPSCGNIMNIDNDFNMDNNYNYTQSNFTNQHFNILKVKADKKYNSTQHFNTHNYNQGKGYYANQQRQESNNQSQRGQLPYTTSHIQQHIVNQSNQQPTSNNQFNTTVTNEPSQVGLDLQKKQKNYRGKYFFNNRIVNGVEQEVYDLDVDLGITYPRKV